MINLLVAASRKKFRFDSAKGQLTLEQLWDLPLQGQSANLDDIARALYKKVQEENVSFVNTRRGSGENRQKLELVQFVIQVRLEELERRSAAAQKAKERDRILEVIADKEDQKLRDLPLDQLRKLAEGLS